MQLSPRKRLAFGFSGDSTQLVGLSLFMLLLAFFLMMNGMSTFSAQRVEAVTDSVQTAFGAAVINLNQGSSLVITSQQRAGTGTSMEEVANAFAHEVPGMKETFVRRTGVLTLIIPVSEMNALLGLSGTRGVDPYLRQTIEFLRDPAKKYEMQLILNRRPALFNTQTPRVFPTDAYLPIWAAAFTNMGVPPEQFSYGIAAGPAGSVSLIIRPVEENAPQAVTPTPSVVPPFTGGGQ